MGCGWSTPRPGRFTSGKRTGTLLKQPGWAPGPVWTGAEISPQSGIRSPERPTRSQPLYRLRYPGPLRCTNKHNIEVLSRNHSCRAKAIRITHSECVCMFQSLVNQPAMRMRRIILSSVASLTLPYSSKFSQTALRSENPYSA